MQTMDDNDSFGHSDQDWENRRLCSDGNCIGVIGPDGRCKECGKNASGETAAADDFFSHPETDNPTDASDAPNMPETENPPNPDMASEADPDWENRRLCSDGNCIGVIGPDGKCKECGKPYI